jgi:hypothetical protein
MQPTIMTNVFYHNKGEGAFIYNLGQPSWACSLSRTIILGNECNYSPLLFEAVNVNYVVEIVGMYIIGEICKQVFFIFQSM